MSPTEWKQLPATITDEQLIIDNRILADSKQQIVQKSMVERLFAAGHGSIRLYGSILECGYGKGFAGQQIIAHKPAHYTVIELNNEVFRYAKSLLPPTCNVLHGDWASVVPTLKKPFDYIFFDINWIDREKRPVFPEFLEKAKHLFHKETVFTCYIDDVSTRWAKKYLASMFHTTNMYYVQIGKRRIFYPICCGLQNKP